MTELPTSPDQPSKARRLLQGAAVICLAEASALIIMAIVELATLSSSRLAVGVTTTIFFVVYAAGLALAARAVTAAQSWARAPLVLSQLIQLGLAWSFLGSGTEWVAILLAVTAVPVLVVLVLPSTTAALYGDASSPGEAKR